MLVWTMKDSITSLAKSIYGRATLVFSQDSSSSAMSGRRSSSFSRAVPWIDTEPEEDVSKANVVGSRLLLRRYCKISHRYAAGLIT